MAITPEDFGSSFKDFLDQMRSQKTPEEAPFFVRKLRDHFARSDHEFFQASGDLSIRCAFPD